MSFRQESSVKESLEQFGLQAMKFEKGVTKMFKVFEL